MSERALETERFLLLIEQMAREPRYGSQKAAMRHLGLEPSYIVKLRKQPERNIGLDALRAAEERLKLQRRFFSDRSLGDDPDYREFVGTIVEREDEEGYPIIEHYIAKRAEQGEPVSDKHARDLRKLRRAYGPDELTEEVVHATHMGLVRRDAGRALERPAIAAGVETDRGQRPLKRR